MYKLRGYQQEAVDNTIQYFKRQRDPAVIVLPTGAGKSLVIAELARVAQGRVLVLAHVKELVEQNHLKYESYNLKAGVYSAGLNKKASLAVGTFTCQNQNISGGMTQKLASVYLWAALLSAWFFWQRQPRPLLPVAGQRPPFPELGWGSICA